MDDSLYYDDLMSDLMLLSKDMMTNGNLTIDEDDELHYLTESSLIHIFVTARATETKAGFDVISPSYYPEDLKLSLYEHLMKLATTNQIEKLILSMVELDRSMPVKEKAFLERIEMKLKACRTISLSYKSRMDYLILEKIKDGLKDHRYNKLTSNLKVIS